MCPTLTAPARGLPHTAPIWAVIATVAVAAVAAAAVVTAEGPTQAPPIPQNY